MCKLCSLTLSNVFFQYYNQKVKYWAADPDDITKVDDIVIIKTLDEPQSDRVKHYIKKVEFPSGQIVDPLTGRRCRGTEFIQEDLRSFGPSQPSADHS